MPQARATLWTILTRENDEGVEKDLDIEIEITGEWEGPDPDVGIKEGQWQVTGTKATDEDNRPFELSEEELQVLDDDLCQALEDENPQSPDYEDNDR